MTEAQLNQIESALNLTLPAEYRTQCRNYPFEKALYNSILPLFDDPETVIAQTNAPMEAGDYDRSGWRETYLAIGETAAGDLYLLDVAEKPSPIYCLSHEDHRIAVEYANFADFFASYKAEEAQMLQAEAQRAMARRQERRRWRNLALGLLAGVFALALAIVFLAPGKSQ